MTNTKSAQSAPLNSEEELNLFENSFYNWLLNNGCEFSDHDMSFHSISSKLENRPFLMWVDMNKLKPAISALLATQCVEAEQSGYEKAKREYEAGGSQADNSVVGANERLGLPRDKMKTVYVAFDVDGTLRCNHTDTCQDPNPRIVELLKAMAHMKNTKIIVWSGGGKEYAERFGKLYELDKYVDIYTSKFSGITPHLAVDDIQDTALGDINLIVREK